MRIWSIVRAAVARLVVASLLAMGATASWAQGFDLRELPFDIRELQFGNLPMNSTQSVIWQFRGQDVEVYFPAPTVHMRRGSGGGAACDGIIVDNLICKGPGIGEGVCAYINNQWDPRPDCRGCSLSVQASNFNGWFYVTCSTSHTR